MTFYQCEKKNLTAPAYRITAVLVICGCMKWNRLNKVLFIKEKNAGTNFDNYDVFVRFRLIGRHSIWTKVCGFNTVCVYSVAHW